MHVFCFKWPCAISLIMCNWYYSRSFPAHAIRCYFLIQISILGSGIMQIRILDIMRVHSQHQKCYCSFYTLISINPKMENHIKCPFKSKLKHMVSTHNQSNVHIQFSISFQYLPGNKKRQNERMILKTQSFLMQNSVSEIFMLEHLTFIRVFKHISAVDCKKKIISGMKLALRGMSELST